MTTNTKIDVLGFLDPAIRDPHSGEVVGHNADIAEARAAVAELIAAAQEVFDELRDADRHDGDEDGIGSRVCCGVVSYAPHSEHCSIARLGAALKDITGESA